MHAGDCAPVYIPPLLPPRGLAFPSLQKFTFFLVLLLRSVSARQWQELCRLLSASPPESGPPLEKEKRRLLFRPRAFCCAHERARRAFLPRPRASCCCNRHGRAGSHRTTSHPASFCLPPCQPALSCCQPLPPAARDQSTRGGNISVSESVFPLAPGAACMHADCREWCGVAGWPRY
jgi:hypothetical protein